MKPEASQCDQFRMDSFRFIIIKYLMANLIQNIQNVDHQISNSTFEHSRRVCRLVIIVINNAHYKMVNKLRGCDL